MARKKRKARRRRTATPAASTTGAVAAQKPAAPARTERRPSRSARLDQVIAQETPFILADLKQVAWISLLCIGVVVALSFVL